MAQDHRDDQILRLRAYVEKLKLQRTILLIPAVLLTLPISIPAIVLFYIRRHRQMTLEEEDNRVTAAERKAQRALAEADEARQALEERKEIDHRYWLARRSERVPPKMPLVQAREAAEDVLIWCPIAVAGLTSQLDQLTEVLRNEGVGYRISYHHPPTAKHPETINWINPDQIRNPRVVFFMERYVPFETGFLDSFHVYYVNLDWLSPESISPARVYADLVIAPTPYRFDELRELFSNSKVLNLPWPSGHSIEQPKLPPPDDAAPLRLLYVGNEYDAKSRKSPVEVVDAILSCDRSDLRIDLKFRSALPADIRARLESCELVDRIIDHPVTSRHMEELYRRADINLIPNTSEGNGLSILEALSKGVVPAVLDGHPMKDVVDSSTSYFIDCAKVGDKRYAPQYQTTADAILSFLNAVSSDGVRQRKQKIAELQIDLAAREVQFQDLVRAVLAINGIISPPDLVETEPGPADAEESPVARTSWYKPYQKETNLIDVFITTSKRAILFETSLVALLDAVRASPYEHRVTVLVDGLDPETDAVIDRHRESIFQCLWTSNRQGLPYSWNTILDISDNMAARTEKVPEFICYIQDDCQIVRPDSYFQDMVAVAEAFEPSQLGFISGFFTEVHSGYARDRAAGREIVLSDSIDGKNFMARPKVLNSIGKLNWWFPNGDRRGNPGPDRGSHFDLWQWKESPRCLIAQGRVNAILPGLCTHIADGPEASTWSNDTTAEATSARVSENRVYRTRV